MAADTTVYKEIEGKGGDYYSLIGWLGAMIAVGLYAVYNMEHHGHVITGMNNAIVWGTPHVFAVFLIVAASGALNVASISSVFGKYHYKPLARLSAVSSLALLAGGLMVLVLDLGRPDRLIVAMTHYNFKSIFAWNIILYNGFFVIVAAYLWMMMERRMVPHSKKAGLFAFVWRLILTTGTGSIFGFLVARPGYDAAIMAPLFIALSFAFGLAFFIILVSVAYKSSGRPLGDLILFKMRNLLGVFVAAAFYFTVVQHLTNLYAAEHGGVESFILMDGGIYTFLFWVVQIGLGTVFPLALLFNPATGRTCQGIVIASILVIIGGLAQMYIIIIGGQAFPLQLFPGMEVSSSFFDGAIHPYTPSHWEVMLGLSGFAVTVLIIAVAVKYLPLLPTSLSDAKVDPHHASDDA
ncbi:NrfD/PsrC family molybdoenzyme membrane anchor subunit [Magnetovibrio sp.]|uniref:NrfD/PsrC family molybdoenzyme membrane anchor subunit n=1 Tax=Magnetovibrio sp. TaxID=2024836 RepID=UPI002F9296D6